jgi:hypothetical protein
MINLQDENVRNLIKALAREELKKMIATEKAELMQNVQKDVAVSKSIQIRIGISYLMEHYFNRNCLRKNLPS